MSSHSPSSKSENLPPAVGPADAALRGNLLVVDDQPTILKLLASQFSQRAYRVHTASSGAEALGVLDREPVDVLITDLMMPEMSGLTLISRTRELHPEVVCIVVTGHAEINSAIEAMRLGAINYLYKPIDFTALEVTIEQGLERQRLKREVRAKQAGLERANRRLAYEMNKNKLILGSVGEGIIGFDAEGRITFVNPAALQMLGWSGRGQVGVKLHDHFRHGQGEGRQACQGDKRCPLVSCSRHGRLRQVSDEWFERHDGSRFPVEYLVSPIREEGRINGAVLLFRDITERKRSQEELELYRDRLEKLVEERTAELAATNEQLRRDIIARKRAEEEAEVRRQQLIEADKMASLGVLVAGVAHEINNPSNFITMNAPILERAWEDFLPIVEEYYAAQGDFSVAGIPFSEMKEHIPELFAGIRDGAERIKRIILSLKDYARQGTPDLKEEVDLNAVIKAALTILANPLKKSTNRLAVRYAESLPPVRGNFQRIEQVLINVIQNAYQALPAADKERGIAITTRHLPEIDTVEVVIEDQGEGIAEIDLKRVQDPFFTTKRDQGGTGLGLSISAGIMEEHGGSIRFASAPGQGTTVMLRFPVAHPA